MYGKGIWGIYPLQSFIKMIYIKKFWWGITVFYILLTYATLGVMPAVWDNLNALLGGKGIFLQYILYFMTGIVIFCYFLFIKKEKSIMKYFLFLLFVSIYFVMFRFEERPGEKIHMAQYGLLGVLLYNALKVDLDRFNRKLYIYGSVICFITGSFDEVIQGILPNRTFTWHDVFINGASGIIALLLIRFNILERT